MPLYLTKQAPLTKGELIIKEINAYKNYDKDFILKIAKIIRISF